MGAGRAAGVGYGSENTMIDAIQRYWNEHIHDLKMTRHAVGTREFFDDLDDYRFDKLHYLPRLVDFKNGFKDRKVLEVGCGIGIDLLRFAQGGARVTGVDLAQTSIDLARKNFELHGLATNNGDGRVHLEVANGEALPFPDNSFDVVYGHGVIQYTADARKLITEMRRVLKPGGQAIFMVYNRVSWLNAMSKVTRVDLEHEDAPVLNKYSIAEFRDLLRDFSKVEIVPERFPVASRLHRGVKAVLFNTIFVGAFNALPKSLVQRYGWHLMAFCVK
jgi:ubiquinone/menaquinone biosynthesis C-methylase UbiE